MAWILNLETASVNCSVSLFEGGALRSYREDRSPEYTHGELLHLFIEKVLQEAGLSANQLQAVAVSKGPGSYTGLRIGVAAAKGLCFALDIPLIALPTLRIMAQAAPVKEGVLIPMLDARRMEVYSAVFDAHLQPLRETRAEILAENSFEEFLTGPQVHLLGSGAAKCEGLLTDAAFRFHPEVLPSSLEMGPLAFEAFREGRFEDIAYFEPYYLKDFIPTGKKPAS
jgi:tRNA threonylcarbamoyladenosine biosynthesis protein TsaB